MEWKLDIDSGAFDKANDLMARSLAAQEKGEIWDSWGLSFAARAHFLAVAVQEIVLVPLSLLYLAFSAVYSLCTWDWDVTVSAAKQAAEKWHHFLTGLLGTFITPTGAYHCRDKIMPVCAVGGFVIKGIFMAALILTKGINYFGFDSEGHFHLGWARR